MYDLGLRIKEIRKKRGMSQRELSRRISKSNTVVCGYESNAQLPPLDVAVSIALVLNTSLDHLVGISEETIYSTKGLSDSQRKILEMLFQEFSCPTSDGSKLSEAQVRLIQEVVLYLSNPNRNDK